MRMIIREKPDEWNDNVYEIWTQGWRGKWERSTVTRSGVESYIRHRTWFTVCE